MGLCLANSLIARRDFVSYDQLVRYKWWFRHGYMSSTGQCFDIGAATSQSLREFERRQQSFATKHHISLDQLDSLSDPDLLTKFDVNCSESGAAGNGALMRLAPVPLFFYRHPTDAVEFSGVSGIITHGDQKAYDACRYYGALIVAALRGEKKTQLLDDNFYLNHKSWFNNKPLTQEVMNVVQGSYKKPGGYRDGIRGKGYIINALEAALWAFCYDENSFEKGVLDAVNLGDDTDTTAAIYGQLAGAYYGYEKLPQKWVKQVYAHNFITCLSKWIVYEGELWQPKLPISSGSGLNSQSYLNDPSQTKTASTSASDIRQTHIQASAATFKELPLTVLSVREPKYSSEVPTYRTYATIPVTQSNTSSRPRTTAALYAYSGGTGSTISGVQGANYGNVASSRYGDRMRSVYDHVTPSSYDHTTQYGHNGATGFPYSSARALGYSGVTGPSTRDVWSSGYGSETSSRCYDMMQSAYDYVTPPSNDRTTGYGYSGATQLQHNHYSSSRRTPSPASNRPRYRSNRLLSQPPSTRSQSTHYHGFTTRNG